MTAFVLGLPEHKVRVVAPDVGGGFGSKIYLYAEDVVRHLGVEAAQPAGEVDLPSARVLPVRRARPRPRHPRRAGDGQGRQVPRACACRTTANLGAYLSTFASCIPTILYATLLAGQYTTPLIYVRGRRAVFTNTAPVDAYRGAGRPEATYVVERLVERAARELELDPVEIRRRNFITTFPYQTPVALQYDTGDYEATLTRRSTWRDVGGFAGAQGRGAESGASCAASATRSYIEACGIAPSNVAGALGARAGLFEAGEIRVHPTGSVTVFTGSHSHGQGHETTFAQVVADRLGHPDRGGRHRARRHRRRSSSAWAPTARARSRSAARRS